MNSKYFLLAFLLTAPAVSFAQTDAFFDASDGCVSISSLVLPAAFEAVQVVRHPSLPSSGSARFEYWWAKCNLGSHKHFYDYVLAFRATAITGSFQLFGNNYVQQGGLEWSVPMVVSAGNGTLRGGGPYSFDVGIINGRTMGFAPGSNPAPNMAINVCAVTCSSGRAFLPPVVSSTENAASFDGTSGLLTIPLVLVGTTRYAAQFILTNTAPMAFSLLAATQLPDH